MVIYFCVLMLAVMLGVVPIGVHKIAPEEVLLKLSLRGLVTAEAS
jgi:hypothetical protein